MPAQLPRVQVGSACSLVHCNDQSTRGEGGMYSSNAALPQTSPRPRCPALHSCRVEGAREGVARAVGILCDAVQRYKDLCEGQYAGGCVQHQRCVCCQALAAPPPHSWPRLPSHPAYCSSSSVRNPLLTNALCLCLPVPPCAGHTVARVQRVGGIDFHYQPPPRSVVPFAAALKGQSSGRCAVGRGRGREGWGYTQLGGSSGRHRLCLRSVCTNNCLPRNSHEPQLNRA